MESKTLLTMLDYEEGIHAAAMGLPLDSNASVDWKEGWNDGHESIYGDEFLNMDDLS